MVAGSSALKGTTTDSFSIPGTQSQKAIDLLQERLPAANGASGRVVFAAEAGQELDASQRTAVTAAVASMAKAPGVINVTDPFSTGLVSADGRIALAQVQWDVSADLLEDSQRDAVTAGADLARSSGISASC